MSLLQPWFLWGLLGLAVPLAIHLLSRKEGPLIRMGSLRHVRETTTRQFRSIRLNEIFLLALRSLIIAVLVLFMSGWYLKDLKDNNRWVLVERGLEKDVRVGSLVDSLKKGGYEVLSLAHDFPPFSPALMPGKMGAGAGGAGWDGSKSVPSLMEDLSNLPIDSIVVIAANRANAFSGNRIALPSNVRWIGVEPVETTFDARTVRLNEDSVVIRRGISSAEQTRFETLRIRSAGSPDSSRRVVAVQIVYDEGFEPDQRVLMAVLTAVKSETPDLLLVRSIPIAKYHNKLKFDWIFWLSASAPEKLVGRVVRIQEKAGMPLLLQDGPNDFILTSRMNSAVAVKENLAARLMQEIFPSPEVREAAARLDVRTIDEKMMWSRKPEALKSAVVAGNERSNWYLMALLLILVVTERLVSYRRAQ